MIRAIRIQTALSHPVESLGALPITFLQLRAEPARPGTNWVSFFQTVSVIGSPALPQLQLGFGFEYPNVRFAVGVATQGRFTRRAITTAAQAKTHNQKEDPHMARIRRGFGGF